MPRTWFSSALSFLALLGAVGLAPEGKAATVLEQSVVHRVEAGGSVVEKTHLRVRLDAPSDLERWSTYHVYLDEHRSLLLLEATATRPDGKPVRVGRRDQDTLEVAGPGTLHSSARFREVSFGGLPVGSLLTIRHEVRVTPYFPAGRIHLLDDDPIEALSVEVGGAGPGFRWRLSGEEPGLSVEELAGGVRLSGNRLSPPDPPEYTPGEAARGPVLRYSWGDGGDWAGVGRWYEGLLAALPRQREEVRRLSRELTAGLEGRRERLDALARFVQEKVRYVAVEVGVGGYRPYPPHETLERRWGDCKDKALLLIDLAREAGIEAYPALVRLSRAARIEVRFASPLDFNHLIVAATAEPLGASAGDPVGSGYLFIDATQTRGGLAWLNPSVQGQGALVIRGDGSHLVEAPVLAQRESERLIVNLAVAPDGSASGGVGLSLEGAAADAFLDLSASATPERLEASLRSALGRRLPGADLGAVSLTRGEGPVPSVALAGAMRVAGLVQGEGDRRSFLLPAFTATPEPRHLAERTVPVVLEPGISEAQWKLSLPEGFCPAQAQAVEASTAVGQFSQSVATEGRAVIVRRATEITRRWVEPEDLPQLRELALAEHRAVRRRIRFACEEPKPPSP